VSERNLELICFSGPFFVTLDTKLLTGKFALVIRGQMSQCTATWKLAISWQPNWEPYCCWIHITKLV